MRLRDRQSVLAAIILFAAYAALGAGAMAWIYAAYVRESELAFLLSLASALVSYLLVARFDPATPELSTGAAHEPGRAQPSATTT